jgi:hypothetical protein
VHITSQEQPICQLQPVEFANYYTQAVEGTVRMFNTLALSSYQPPNMFPEVILQNHSYMLTEMP